jgi:hypothetical protein
MKLARSMAAFLMGGAFLAWPARADDGASIPDFAGLWARTAFGFEMPVSGPGPLRNLNRRADGASDATRMAGDYASPILKPEAAAVVKKNGEIAAAGVNFDDPSNTCHPMSTPFIMRVQEIELLQEKDQVTILYMQDAHVRRVRMNARHPEDVQPSWSGDSIGHYEGDTLVVDTVGLKRGPRSALDAYGTPYSEALHVVERYRMIDNAEARAATARSDKEYGRPDGPTGDGVFADTDHPGKVLQVRFTVEDGNVFTMPWTGLVTFWPATNNWEEHICAENMKEYYDGTDTQVPQAENPDF